jgi:ABC-type dipeptide/oligopeptide/nickel transport system permease component
VLGFLARRLVGTVVVFAGLVVVAFLITDILPGDPARLAAGRNATAAQVAAVRRQLGLDRPLPARFWDYVERICHGDLGQSVFTHRSVLSDIGQVLPSSAELVVAAMIINVAVALPLGVAAAYRRGQWTDISTRLVVLIGAALPSFWLALILQWIFADKFKVFPLSGQLGFGLAVPRRTGATTVDALLAGDFGAFVSAFDHLVLPAVTLTAAFLSVVARTVRSSMLTALEADYITLARATGASEWRVVVRHGLRNAFVPTSSILGMQVGWMLGATVLVESTFARTGLGAYMVTAVLQDDVYAVAGSVLVIGVIVIVSNLLVDLMQLWLNPRLREPRTARTELPPVGLDALAGATS